MVVAEKNTLPLDFIGQLETQLEEKPLDYGLWHKLIDQVIIKDKAEQVRSTFEKYLNTFKFDAKQWASYINFELNRGDFSLVEKLFARCLPITTDVEICRTYVLYVRRVNDVITGGEKARSTVVQAFNFAVNKVGVDMESSFLWNDYLDFFKSWTPGTTWEQQQKTDLIRKLYKRCLVIPNAKIESMWSDYTKWENSVSTPNSASKFIADLSTSYMEARSWSTEWQNVTKNLIRRKVLALSPESDQSSSVADQVQLWFAWIELEKKNSLNLSAPDLAHRIEYVYKRAISILPFVPEVWFRYSQFNLDLNPDANREACILLLSNGVILNPGSYLLNFQLAELYEREGTFPKAQQTLESLITHLSAGHDQLVSSIEQIKQSATASQKNGGSDTKNRSDDDDDEDDITTTSRIITYTESQALQILALDAKVKESIKRVTVVYIKLMALCKRSQGIKEVRAIFKQRKNFKDMGYQFYVENAWTEFYSDNKKIADKVFDLAMKAFGKNGAFLYAYLEYLISSNSIESLKVFFEVAVTTLLKEIEADKEVIQVATNNLVDQRISSDRLNQNEYFMRKIIKRYIRFASGYLDLDTVLSLSKRYTQYFPEDDDLALFADRYRDGDFDGIAKFDLGDSLAFACDDNAETETSTKRRKINRDKYSPEAGATGKAAGKAVGKASLPMPPKPQGPSVQPQHGFVGHLIYNLLQVLPNAGYFGPSVDHVFNSGKLVELFTHIELPGEN